MTKKLVRQTASVDPSPAELVEAADELAQLKQGLDEAQRSMLEMRLEGFQIEEIAQAAGKSEKTVRRMLEKLRAQLRDRAYHELK